jgi:hypothetical protein
MIANNFTEQNPSVFPLPLGTMDCAEPSQSGGMTLRDYFAATALQGIIAASDNMGPSYIPLVAKTAYKVADAMLEARSV